MCASNGFDINLCIGRKLREKRKKAGLTLEKISEALLVTYQQIQKYESGQSKIPINKLYEFSRLYKVPIQDFFDDIAADTLSKNTCMTIAKDNAFITDKVEQPLSILLIEDDPVDEFITRRVINEIDNNVTVFCVHNEIQTIDFLKRRMQSAFFSWPDLILMEINVSKKDTTLLLSEIKRDKAMQELPIIILTNNINANDMLKTYQNGASSFIHKSSNIEEFKHNMTICLEYWSKVVILPSILRNIPSID